MILRSAEHNDGWRTESGICIAFALGGGVVKEKGGGPLVAVFEGGRRGKQQGVAVQLGRRRKGGTTGKRRKGRKGEPSDDKKVLLQMQRSGFGDIEGPQGEGKAKKAGKEELSRKVSLVNEDLSSAARFRRLLPGKRMSYGGDKTLEEKSRGCGCGHL